ncbi:MAG TPA: glycosyltransferase, partial [Gemmatimonadaceae bacterium]|nr:glycosyltransferase [Gemmatimonadaceae bacterium]
PSAGHRTDSPRKVVQVAAPGEVGGLESVVLALSVGQMRRGHDVTVLLTHEPRADRHPFAAALENAGVPTETIAVPARAYWKERGLVKEFCERERPDVMHTHGYRPDILHAASRVRRDFATVTTIHGSSRVGGASTFHEQLQMLLLRRFDAVIAVSNQLAESLRSRHVPASRLHIIPNAWEPRFSAMDRSDARSTLGLPHDGIVIGWIGRLIPIKGADVFINALARLRIESWTAAIIGDGTERARLQVLVDEAGLTERVRFQGAVTEAARCMRAFDVLVLSSRSEGTPITLLEAMSAGVPVVATRVGGVPEVVREREAVLVPPEDPESLANGIARVLLEPELAAAQARAAANRLMSAFDVEKWVDAHDRVYDLAVNSLASGHRNGVA